ncbi:MAG: anhydro-N-acetylmuramic acid kinase [Bacteroidales bacterium]|nr:anhydro-N-acetylmuramic acid kinase [Bacteroidales bacterium]
MSDFIRYKSIGVMSGTSIDGLDFAACEFQLKNSNWEYKIIETETFEYNNIWQERLANAHKLTGIDLSLLNIDFGFLIAEYANKFMNKYKLKKDDYILSCHGHTVFHQPNKFLTLQIGSGAHIAVRTQMKVVNDFRIQDLALGGQGAPLVPIGDELLFSDYQACLNIGGFANCSYNENGKRIAFDICPANIVLNELAKIDDKTYDIDGEIGRKGKVNLELLEALNALEFYTKDAPKSLGREWVERNIFPIINTDKVDYYDIVATYYQHIACQINNQLSKFNKILTTGGGAHNKFLMEKLNELNPNAWDNNNKILVDFKEAVIFAFLGVLKVLKQNNVLASVTGAIYDHSSGLIWE